jgi:hypothetical protein
MNILKFSDFHKANLLTEGLIKVPKDLLKSMCDHIASQYVSYMNTIDKCKEDAKIVANKYDVQIDPNFEPVNKDVELNTVLEGVPERVKNAWKLEFGHLRLIIDWESKIWKDRPKVNASYEESDAHGIPGYFTINPRALIECVNGDYRIDDAIEILNKAQYSAWHEASHAVQHNALKWMNKNQVSKSRTIRDNPDSSKEDRRREYLSAQVEFDPQIKTKIYIFNQKYGTDPENIRKNLAAFVAAVSVDDINPDEFFLALKNTDLRKWKRAVKLMYLNYQFDISDLLRSIPDTEG